MKAILDKAKNEARKALTGWNETNGYKGLANLDENKTEQFFTMEQYKEHLEHDIEVLKSQGSSFLCEVALAEACQLVIEEDRGKLAEEFRFCPCGGVVYVKSESAELAEEKLERAMTIASKAFEACGILYESYGFCLIDD